MLESVVKLTRPGALVVALALLAFGCTSSGGTGDPARCEPVISHEATELESLLPASVQGRDLTRWSVRGRCWLELGFGRSEADIEEVVAAFENPDDQQPIDLANLTYGVAGRSDTSRDPPYLVFGAWRPWEPDESDLALYLFFEGAGYRDPASGPDLSNYEGRTMADKTVFVGTTEMLDQDEHQRGRPYLYQTDDYWFMVVADDDAWAADALGQLPWAGRPDREDWRSMNWYWLMPVLALAVALLIGLRLRRAELSSRRVVGATVGGAALAVGIVTYTVALLQPPSGTTDEILSALLSFFLMAVLLPFVAVVLFASTGRGGDWGEIYRVLLAVLPNRLARLLPRP